MVVPRGRGGASKWSHSYLTLLQPGILFEWCDITESKRFHWSSAHFCRKKLYMKQNCTWCEWSLRHKVVWGRVGKRLVVLPVDRHSHIIISKVGSPCFHFRTLVQ